MFNNTGAVLPLIAGKQLRGLAVTSLKRSPLAPQFAPIAEEGVPGFDVTSWYGIFAPAKAPTDIVRKMNADFVAAIRDPGIKARLDQLGVAAIASTPAELGHFSSGKWTNGARSSRKPASPAKPGRGHHIEGERHDQPPPTIADFRVRACVRCCLPALAQTWPNRSVRLVVPFPAGGGADAIARIVGQRLSEMWGQQVVIENRGGASGNLAADNVAHSAPDGYTMFIAGDFQAVNVFMFPKLNYHPVNDFAPVSMVVQYTNAFVVPNNSPAKTLQEFIALAKSKPLTFASPGHGVSGHMSGELFMREAGIKMTGHPLSRRQSCDPGSDPRPRRQFCQQPFAADLAASEQASAHPGSDHRLALAAGARNSNMSRNPDCPALTCPAGTRSSFRPRRRLRSCKR